MKNALILLGFFALNCSAAPAVLNLKTSECITIESPVKSESLTLDKPEKLNNTNTCYLEKKSLANDYYVCTHANSSKKTSFKFEVFKDDENELRIGFTNPGFLSYYINKKTGQFVSSMGPDKNMGSTSFDVPGVSVCRGTFSEK